MKKQYLTVEGYIHPLHGGDDYPFMRGFVIQEKQRTAFEVWFKKDYEKISEPVDDYIITEITKEEWEASFEPIKEISHSIA